MKDIIGTQIILSRAGLKALSSIAQGNALWRKDGLNNQP
jgi:hypothetical protein